MPSSFEAERFRIDAEMIEKINPKPGEDSEIEKLHAIAANSREILQLSSSSVNLLTESEDSLLERLTAVRRLLLSMERVDEESAVKFQEQLEQISEAIRNLSDEITAHAETVDLDAESFAAIEERIHDLQSLKRKFGPTINDILHYLEEAKLRLDIFENSEFAREKADQKVVETEKIHLAACQKLSKSRKAAAGTLEELLKKELIKLGFKRSEFQIAFEKA